MNQFTSLGLSAPLLRALADEGYATPTPIQSKAIPPALEGRDLLGCAQTGTGKTAAFALPILHRLAAMAKAAPAPVEAPAAHAPAAHGHAHGHAKHSPGRHHTEPRQPRALPRALILAPTRELASQIGESFATYGRHKGLTHTVIFGGVSQFHQVKALQRGVDIVVATPGRLMDLMEQRVINLSQVCIFVLDEADRMLDMGFIQPIRRIAAALPKPTAAAPRQTMLFSATMPKEIMHLAESLLNNPVRVAVTPVASTVPLIEQSIYMIGRERKSALLRHLLEEGKVERAIVFTKTKHGADKLSRKLAKVGISNEAIHGNKAQNARIRALDAFRSGRSRVLVATDVAARGLDVDGISHVFNFDLPMEPEAYVHRIGRTGRAGASGIAISFCDSSERGLLRDIERLTGKRINAMMAPNELPDMPEPGPSASSEHSHRSSHGHSSAGGGDRSRRGPGQRPAGSHSAGHRSAGHHTAGHSSESRAGSAPSSSHARSSSAPHGAKPHGSPAKPGLRSWSRSSKGGPNRSDRY